MHALHGGVCPALAILVRIINSSTHTSSFADEISSQRGMVIHSFYVQEVPNKGYGIFARERISKGAYLFEYVG